MFYKRFLLGCLIKFEFCASCIIRSNLINCIKLNFEERSLPPIRPNEPDIASIRPSLSDRFFSFDIYTLFGTVASTHVYIRLERPPVPDEKISHRRHNTKKIQVIHIQIIIILIIPSNLFFLMKSSLLGRHFETLPTLPYKMTFTETSNLPTSVVHHIFIRMTCTETVNTEHFKSTVKLNLYRNFESSNRFCSCAWYLWRT